jgi:hypothetical protein
MYGLPQAGKLANEQLIQLLTPHGYCPVPLTPGLWRHDTRDLTFSLVVDDFGIKYTNKADANHLIAALTCCNYQVSLDWEGSWYCNLSLEWDYLAFTCDVSMPRYIARALQRFQRPTPPHPKHSSIEMLDLNRVNKMSKLRVCIMHHGDQDGWLPFMWCVIAGCQQIAAAA